MNSLRKLHWQKLYWKKKDPKIQDLWNKFSFVYICTSIDRSRSFSDADFPCPLKSIATTRAFSLILLAANANESLPKMYHTISLRHITRVWLATYIHTPIFISYITNHKLYKHAYMYMCILRKIGISVMSLHHRTFNCMVWKPSEVFDRTVGTHTLRWSTCVQRHNRIGATHTHTLTPLIKNNQKHALTSLVGK